MIDDGGSGVVPPPIRPQREAKIMEGERELTSGLLSRDTRFRLIVSGEIGVKEIERLIKKLELDKEILADHDEDQTEHLTPKGRARPHLE